jgi:hypothetical protein
LRDRCNVVAFLIPLNDNIKLMLQWKCPRLHSR